MRTPLRVLVISPRVLIREGLGAILRVQPHIRVVGDSADISLAARADFDIALFDAHDATPRALPFRFLALLPDPSSAPTWLGAGSAGCILENASVEELLTALRQAARGEIYLPPSITREIVSSESARAENLPLVEPLTDRERDVLRLLARGLNNKDIAQKLYLSVRTVEGHLANIYGKLQVKSRTEAALWAARNRSFVLRLSD